MSNWWWVMACTSSTLGKFWLWSSIWPWRSWSIIPQNNRALNQGLLHLWSKFGDPSLNGWWVIARTNSWLTDTQTHTHIHTHAGNDNTRRPKLASGKNPDSLFMLTKWNLFRDSQHGKISTESCIANPMRGNSGVQTLNLGTLLGGHYWGYYPGTLSCLSNHSEWFKDLVPIKIYSFCLIDEIHTFYCEIWAVIYMYSESSFVSILV